MPPDVFGRQTIGSYSIYMRGVERKLKRLDQDARAHAYMTAFLFRQRELPDFMEWVTGKRDRAAFVRKWTAEWDKIDAALAASKGQSC